MAVAILLELPVRPDAENVDEILSFDLPATAAYPGNGAPTIHRFRTHLRF